MTNLSKIVFSDSRLFNKPSSFYLKIIFVVVIFLAFYFDSVGRLSHRMTKWSDDEYHSIYLSSQHTFSKVSDSRVFGGVRLALRLTYPFSLYYMNSRMGGEHYVTGWDYPGHYYILNNLKPDQNVISQDPNLQDFIFFQRLSLSTFFIVSVCFVCYSLWSLSPLSSLLYALIIWVSPIIITELSYAYADLFLATITNFIFGVFLISNRSIRKSPVLLTVLAAVATAAKLNGFLVALPVVFYLYVNRREIDQKPIVLIIIFLVCSFFLNIYELLSPDSFLHYTLANVYHYKTGHLITVPDGLYQIKSGLQIIGSTFYAFIASLVIGLFLKNEFKGDRFIYISIVVVSIAIFMLLSGVRFFVPRNYTIVVILLSLFSAMVWGRGLNKLNVVGKYSSLLCVILAIVYLVAVTTKYKQISPLDQWAGLMSSCKKIGVIGDIETNNSQYFKIPSIPDSYNFTLQRAEFERNVNDFDCILAKWDKNNKTYTNYILPKHYRLLDRVGNTFIFKKAL